MVRAFEKASKCSIPYVIQGRRAGDIAKCYASPDLSRDHLGWTAQYELDQMMEHHWRWQSLNPEGY